MSVTVRAAIAALVAALTAAALTGSPRISAQGSASTVEALHFHHVHLNSMDPAAAAAYYPKPFAQTAVKTTFNGFEAVKTGNIYILFTKVNTPPQNELTGPQTSVWHFGWNTPNSRQYNDKFRAMGLQIAQMWDAADGKLVDLSSDTLPGLPTQEQILELRAKGVQPTREGGFGYLRGPDGAMIENAQSGTVERFNHVHMYHEHPRCAMEWYTAHLGAKMPQGRGGGAPPAGDRRLSHDDVCAADVAVVREDRLRPRALGRRAHRRHFDLDPSMAGRRTRQHARQARGSLGRQHSEPRRDRRAIEERERQVPRGNPSVGHDASGHDRGTGPNRDRDR